MLVLRGFYLRPALSRDLEAIVHLEREAFDAREQNRLEVFADALHDAERQLFVHAFEDTVDAYLLWRTQRGGACIESLAVREAQQRRGLGTRMLEWLAARELDRGRRITATFNERNTPMQLLLQKLGFRCVRITRGLYPDSSDLALTFRLTPERGRELGLLRPGSTHHEQP